MASSANYKPGELLVIFEPGFPKEKAIQVITGQGGRIIREVSAQNLFHIKLKPGDDPVSAAKRFEQINGVSSAEPNYQRRLR